MPRARQMPRTRAVRALQTAIVGVALAAVAGGAAVVRVAGASWLAVLAGYVVEVVLVVLAVKAAWPRLDRLASRARERDVAELDPQDRALPYGAYAGPDGAVLLPSKVSVTVLVWVIAVGLLVGGVAVARVGDPGMLPMGAVLALIGAWCCVLGYWVTGTKIRLTRDGVETRMRPRQFFAWMEVPELKVDQQIVILKAAGAKRPRVWIRAGVLEISVADCVAVIRRQRSW